MKRIFLAVFLCCCNMLIFAQQSTSYTGAVISEVTVVEVPEREAIIMTNVPTQRIIDNKSVEIADVSAYTLKCGEHQLVLKANGYYTKKKKFAVWPNAKNEYYYKMVKKPVLPTQWQQFVMLDYTWGGVSAGSYSETNSIGLRYGQQKIVGWYVAMNVSLQGAHYARKALCLGTTDKVSRNKFSLMGGANIWLGCPLYFYTGMGYGYENALLVSPDGKSTRPLDYNYPNSGVAWEFGLQGGYKGATLRFGYALIGSKTGVFHEISLGLGYTFNLKK